MAADYVLPLANGLYMGSDGNFLEIPPQGVPIIESSKFEFPVDPSKVKNTLQSIKEGIEDATGDLDTLEFLAKLGITDELLDALRDFGQIAGTLAKFVPYVQAAYALLDFFGLLGKKGAVEPALKQRFDQIDKILIAQDRKWTEVKAAEARNTVTSFLDAVTFYADMMAGLDEVPPSATAWAALDVERQLKLAAADGTTPDGSVVALKTMCDAAVWQSLITGLDPEDPEGSWDAFRPLNLQVQDASGNSQPAPAAHVGTVSRFDHRAMAHYVPALVHSYLGSIKLLLPEYRSVGRFRDHLKDVADAIESLMRLMRLNLGRTHFINAEFPNPLWRPGAWWGPGFPPQPRVDVGGYDVIAKVRPVKDELGNLYWPTPGIWDTSDNVADLGAITYNWPAPADYRTDGTRDGQGWYKWDLQNQAACVEALNAESAVRFGALLYSSGYLQLAQTAALLRHLCCAPEASETVMAGFRNSNKAGPATTVPVESKTIAPFKTIVGQGTRISRSISVKAHLLMQSPIRSTTDPVTYKVYLRTMPARGIDARSDYSSFYWASRKRIPNQDAQQGQAPMPAIDTLVCSYTEGHLDQHLLVEGRTERTVLTGTPPDGPVKLAADTFDIWVPVPDGIGMRTDVFTGIETTSATTAAGNKPSSRFVTTIDELVRKYTATPEQPAVGDDVSVKAPEKQRELGNASVPDPRGERRNLKRGEVTLNYEWIWDGPLLEIDIEVDGSNPNTDLYLVVEEQIVDNQWRHSAFRIPMATQLTYVPQSFLDAEAEEADKANSFWRGLVSKYVEAAALSPEDPIVQFGRVSLRDVDQRMDLQAVVEKHAPEFLAAYSNEYRARNGARAP